MKFRNGLKILGLSLVFSLATAGLVFAQQDNTNNQNRGRGGFAGGNFDPERFQQMQVERATTDLKMSSQEAKVITPKIEALIKYRFSTIQELQPLRQDLGDLVNADKPNEKAIKQQLDKIKAKALEIKKKSDAMEADLKAILTIQQEAQLTLHGVITNGMGVGGMGFGGGRGGFGAGGRGGNRGANRGGNNNQ